MRFSGRMTTLRIRTLDPFTEAAAQLNYQVNLVGRALRQTRSSTVGLVVPDLENPYFSALAQQLSRVFSDPGIDLLNRASDNLGYQTLLVGCAGLFVAGAIILMPVKTGWLKEAKAEPTEPK